ncbi:FkbM family methyltransferase [Caballeronia calidae]|uniref:FkbM family methyltransferase n=1 Tax=Caballeronia calidae TaxID=1777139 RepID=A0A158EIW7_9BURK|nr:FkbM family methyltransferase [Caballeronia calidae]SAL06832.1 FkbM family methyltransferase [Caballeronia calidae]
MIVALHNDYNVSHSNYAYGVGHQILQHSCFDANEVGALLALLNRRRQYFGDGVFAIDGGANIGVHTIEWARHMHDWGRVLSFEAQEIVYYALAGNIALNNCLNARAKLAALGESPGELIVPQPDYFAHASFGSLELRQQANTEYIGQRISYAPSAGAPVPVVSIDSLHLERIDLIKLDVEGMEVEVLRGAQKALENHKPILSIEIIKSDQSVIKGLLDERGYRHFPAGANLLAIHLDDPVLQHIGHDDGVTYLN